MIAAHLVDQPACGDGGQPAARIGRHAVGRPLHGRREQCLLYRVLALLELPVATDEHAEDLRRQLAQQVLGGGFGRHISTPLWYMIGRTSMPVPSTLASGISAASSM